MFRKHADRRNVSKSVRAVNPNNLRAVATAAITQAFRKAKGRAIDLEEQLFDMLPPVKTVGFDRSLRYAYDPLASDNPYETGYDFDPYADCTCELCRYYPEERVDTTVEYKLDQNKATEIAKMWAWYEENVA
jgi:hypothetical protein